MREDFPYRKQIGENRFAYIVLLTYGRARINVASVFAPMSVDDTF